MMNQLYLKDNYSDIKALVGSFIREYDISKANISILFSKGALSPEQYEYYYNLPKRERVVQIGYYLRDHREVIEILKSGLVEYRKLFLESNNINDCDILSIKRDAIFIIDKIPTITKFGLVEFVFKNEFTSFYKLNRYELFYYNNRFNNIENLIVKGVNDSILVEHKNYLIEFFLYIFDIAESNGIEAAIKEVARFMDNYKNLSIDIGFYREFNSNNSFRIKSGSIFKYFSNNFSENDKRILNINYNFGLLNELLSLYSHMYINRSNIII